MIKATLSRVLVRTSGEQQVCNSGTCCVRQRRGPRAHNNESSNTDKLPDTAICP